MTTVQQSALAAELALLARVAGKEMPNLLIEAAGGLLTMTASDYETAMKCAIPATVDAPFRCLTKAAPAAKYVASLPDVALNMEASSSRFTIRRDKGWAALPIADPNTFGEFPRIEAAQSTCVEASLLATAIAHVLPSIPDVGGRQTVAGARVSIDGNDVQLVSTDGHRLTESKFKTQWGASRWERRDEVQQLRAIIPQSALEMIARLCAGQAIGTAAVIEVSGGTDRTRATCSVGNRILSFLPITERFPAVERLLSVDPPEGVKVNRESLLRCLDRALTVDVGKAASNRLSLAVSNGQAEIVAEGIEDSIEDQADVEGAASFDIRANGTYIRDFARAVADETITMAKASDFAPLNLTASGARCIIMGMRT